MQSCTHQPYAYDMRKERTFPCGEKRSSSTFPKPRLGRSGGRALHLCIGRRGRDEKNHSGGFLVHPGRRHYRFSSLSSCWWIELWRGERESIVGMTQSTSDSFDTCCSSLRVEYYNIITRSFGHIIFTIRGTRNSSSFVLLEGLSSHRCKWRIARACGVRVD